MSEMMKYEKNNINTITKPLINPEEAIASFNEYQKLSTAICKPEDVQRIGEHDFKKKSFWRKVYKFFGLNLELLKENSFERQILINVYQKTLEGKYGEYQKEIKEILGYYPVDYQFLGISESQKVIRVTVFEVTYRAIAPNGQYMDGDGSCDTFDNNDFKTWHDARATAHTRAKNRAIADIVGFGEVSAEEVTTERYENGNGKKNNSPQKNNYQKPKDTTTPKNTQNPKDVTPPKKENPKQTAWNKFEEIVKEIEHALNENDKESLANTKELWKRNELSIIHINTAIKYFSDNYNQFLKPKELFDENKPVNTSKYSPAENDMKLNIDDKGEAV